MLFAGFVIKGNAQNGLHFQSKSLAKQSISFKLINSLIVIPVEVNGETLSFILDTGMNKTIIFNLLENDSIGLSNPEKIGLRGFGGGKSAAAILSKNNSISIKNIVGYTESICVILNDFFDLSSRMGTTIHDIIGYNLLKNFVIKINYITRKIVFYKPENFILKKCRKCEILPIQFHGKKP